MQVRTGHASGAADAGDLLAGVHLLADHDIGALQVRIQRLPALAVVDHHHRAVLGAVRVSGRCRHHAAVRGRHYRGAGACTEIGAAVRALPDAAGIAEMTGDPWCRQRCLEPHLDGALADRWQRQWQQGVRR